MPLLFQEVFNQWGFVDKWQVVEESMYLIDLFFNTLYEDAAHTKMFYWETIPESFPLLAIIFQSQFMTIVCSQFTNFAIMAFPLPFLDWLFLLIKKWVASIIRFYFFANDLQSINVTGTKTPQFFRFYFHWNF